LAVVQISATGFAPPSSGLDGKRAQRTESSFAVGFLHRWF